MSIGLHTHQICLQATFTSSKTLNARRQEIWVARRGGIVAKDKSVYKKCIEMLEPRCVK